ncbi:hypothetical protein PAXRUDRAFT_528940 [Paxillus rubicundulus Ve08.2h10]|uniref:Uncharacterized protein n=1 Tax=Paxillus rubicundulus Ve08.2h10 TaxID=930991 RepID=A0A0D0DN40_9AGAM|nr:hypothetical protein PAXRUDRAFT_528940 [Paxillus rubicundulus Ve08.2h10]
MTTKLSQERGTIPPQSMQPRNTQSIIVDLHHCRRHQTVKCPLARHDHSDHLLAFCLVNAHAIMMSPQNLHSDNPRGRLAPSPWHRTPTPSRGPTPHLFPCMYRGPRPTSTLRGTPHNKGSHESPPTQTPGSDQRVTNGLWDSDRAPSYIRRVLT